MFHQDLLVLCIQRAETKENPHHVAYYRDRDETEVLDL